MSVILVLESVMQNAINGDKVGIRIVNVPRSDFDRNYASENDEMTAIAGRQVRSNLFTNCVYLYSVKDPD